jgi:hypothetical protein
VPECGLGIPTPTEGWWCAQGYATAVGEYLMMLPSLLESVLVAADAEDPEEDAHVDGEWLDKARGPDGQFDVYVYIVHTYLHIVCV